MAQSRVRLSARISRQYSGMRYFLYTYAYPENYRITRQHRVFGTPKYGGDHLAATVRAQTTMALP